MIFGCKVIIRARIASDPVVGSRLGLFRGGAAGTGSATGSGGIRSPRTAGGRPISMRIR